MFRKHISFLASIICLAVLTSCLQSGNETPVTSAYEDETTAPSTDFDDSDTQFDESTENSATDFQYEVSPNGKYVYINKYIGEAKNVIIPAKINDLPVTALKGIAYNDNGAFEGTFENCSIETVLIPETVQSIGYKAFKGCEELSNVTISPKSNMTIIGGSAFENCINLESFDFSLTHVTVLDGRSFAGCTKMKDIKFPDSLLEIGEQAFYECSSIIDIQLPKTLAKIGKSAFAYCTSLKNITIPTTLDLFAYEEPPFHNNSALKKITFEEGREEISGYAFFSTTTNVEILIPKSVKKFSPDTFLISGSAEIVFLGDCPEIIEKDDFYGEPTIYFDPNTKGWYDCAWRNKYTLITIDESNAPTADSDKLPTDTLKLDPIADTSNNLYYSVKIERTDSNNWLENANGAIVDVYFSSSDKVGVVCDLGSEWTFEDGIYTDSENNKVLTKSLYLVQLLSVPKGSFTCTVDDSDTDRMWLNDKVFRIQGENSTLYYVKTELGDAEHDCIAYFADDNHNDIAATDKFFMSVDIMQTALRIYNNDDVKIYQYDHNTLLIVPNNGDSWTLDSYSSDADFDVVEYKDGKATVRIYDAPNRYDILIDPIKQNVIDTHVSEAELVDRLGQSDNYISCTYYQYYGGAQAYFLYSDRIVCVNENKSGKFETTTTLLHETKPEDTELEDFYKKIANAIVCTDPNSPSYIYYSIGTGGYYHIAERSPFSNYDSYHYYLSCLFTEESVDYLMNWKNMYGYEYTAQSSDGLLYICADMERGSLVPNIEDMVLVLEDKYWKCDLLA